MDDPNAAGNERRGAAFSLDSTVFASDAYQDDYEGSIALVG